MQSHVTLQKVHQVILEATVGGEAGDVAIDDISLISGPCSQSGKKPENVREKIVVHFMCSTVVLKLTVH